MFNMKCALFLFSSLYIIIGANADEDLASSIDPCNWKDKDCILESAKKLMPKIVHGVPSLGMASLEPVLIDFINGDIEELKLNVTNVVVKGLSGCTIISVSRPEEFKVNIILECPITVTGNYEASGNILKLPVFGNDEYVISSKKMKIEVTINLAKNEKNGQTYYKLGKFDYKFVPADDCKMFFKNINKGADTEQAIIKILDETCVDMMTTYGKRIIQAILLFIIKVLGKFFSSIPANQLEKA